MNRVYLDSNATTEILPEVFDVMVPFLKGNFGNPSSSHSLGRVARSAIEEAREKVALLIGAAPSEIIFCSGGSEANNMALKGASWTKPADGKWKAVTSAVEHSSILKSAEFLPLNGYNHQTISVDSDGIILLDELEAALNENVMLVSVMHSNNETGTIQPIKEISACVKPRGILMHTDAVQSAGKVAIDVDEIDVDMLSISAHKLHGPKGVGALYLRKGKDIEPLLSGGGHERGKRAGTENVAGIVGFGKACELAMSEMAKNSAHVTALRDELERRIFTSIPHLVLNGHSERRLPNTLNISIEGTEGEMLQIQCDLNGLAVSTGSACSSGSTEPSHVLLEMGIPPGLVNSSIRFSFSKLNTMEDVDFVMGILPGIIQKAREASPTWGNAKPIPPMDI